MPEEVKVTLIKNEEELSEEDRAALTEFRKVVSSQHFHTASMGEAEAMCTHLMMAAVRLLPTDQLVIAQEFALTAMARATAATLATQCRHSQDPLQALTQRFEAFTNNVGTLATGMLREVMQQGGGETQ